MPLSFKSQSHGNIAFGFFNIESDMLLLENHFFFADDFCQWMIQMAKQDNAGQKRICSPVYYIEDSKDIGDLMGAIHGICFTGFIGKVYKLFPFPDDPKLFKQNPRGYQTRKIVAAQIKSIAKKTEIVIEFSKDKLIYIGPYVFDKRVFHDLIQYVCKGGYPCWKGGVKPCYVMEMEKNIQKSCSPFFKGVFSS